MCSSLVETIRIQSRRHRFDTKREHLWLLFDLKLTSSTIDTKMLTLEYRPIQSMCHTHLEQLLTRLQPENRSYIVLAFHFVCFYSHLSFYSNTLCIFFISLLGAFECCALRSRPLLGGIWINQSISYGFSIPSIVK